MSGFFQDKRVRMNKRVVMISNALDPSGDLNFTALLRCFIYCRHQMGKYGSSYLRPFVSYFHDNSLSSLPVNGIICHDFRGAICS